MEQHLLDELKRLTGKECCNIILTETGNTIENDDTPITASKILGNPFFPAYMEKEYPHTTEGVPLVMFAQINFAQIPPMTELPTSGLLQIYLNPFNWNDGEHRIFYFTEEELKQKSLDIYGHILSEWLDDEEHYLPARFVHTMEFEKNISYSGADDRFFQRHLSEIRDKYSAKVQEEYAQAVPAEFDCRIGGYSDFTQYDPRTDTPCYQLLQIDSVEGINFYDCGIMHIFIDKESLKAREFDKAYMTVDFY